MLNKRQVYCNTANLIGLSRVSHCSDKIANFSKQFKYMLLFDIN